MADQETNVSIGFETTLSSSLASGATTINVTTTTGAPSVPFYVIIDRDDDAKREEILVDDGKTGTTLTLTAASKRGQGGTSDVSHDAGALVTVGPTGSLWTDINDRVDGHTHTGGTDGTQLDHGGLAGLTDDDHTQYLKADGTRALSGDLSAGSNKITNVTDPTSAQDAATKTYVDTAEQDAKDYADTQDTAQTATLQAYADTAEADAKTYADGLDTAVRADLTAVAYFRGNTTSKSIASGSSTTIVPLTISGPGAVNDDGTIWSYDGTNDVMVSAVAGLFLVTGLIRWSAFTDGDYSDVRIYRIDTDGTTEVENHWRDQRTMAGGLRDHNAPPYLVELTAGQGVQLRARHSNASGQTLAFAQMRAVLLRNDS